MGQPHDHTGRHGTRLPKLCLKRSNWRERGAVEVQVLLQGMPFNLRRGQIGSKDNRPNLNGTDTKAGQRTEGAFVASQFSPDEHRRRKRSPSSVPRQARRRARMPHHGDDAWAKVSSAKALECIQDERAGTRRR
jgi:hypothetical protein